MKTTRRDFLKISSIGIGGLMLSSPLINLFKSDAEKESEKFDEMQAIRTPNYCEVCFWNCAAWVYTTADGQIWKILGHEDDPNCNGRLCPRGTGGLGMYTDNDRLKKPLIRTETDGIQSFKEVEWTEALDFIAEKLKAVKEKHGAESVALFNHGTSGKHFTHLLQAFGSKNFAGPAYSQCKAPREEAFQATFGHALHSPEPLDIRDTKCLVLIGSHLGENMHNGQVQEMSDAIDNGATIITVDPRFSTAASKSKYWLPIKPATDIALLLAWTNVIIEEELYDKNYVEKYTYGFDLLKEHVKTKTPEWAYGITTIEPSVIRQTAREMANASPAVIIHPGRHVTWYGDDTQRLRAVAILNALLGSWGRRGGIYIPEAASVPKFKSKPYPSVNWKWDNIYPEKYPLATIGVTNVLVDASHPDNKSDKSIKAWLIVGTNLIATMPNISRTLEALQNMEFVVVVDTMPAEITSYADVVLPECTYLERYDDLRLATGRIPTISLRMPAAEPRFESKPGWWMAKELANRLDLADYFPYEDYSEVLDWQLQQVGSSLEEMKKIGVKVLERTYDDLYFHEGEEHEFETNTGKIELFSTSLQAAGFDALPNYKENAQPQAGFYRLIYGRAPMHTFSRTTNNPLLCELQSENKLWVNPKVAEQWGLVQDQEVWLQNQDGKTSNFSIKVRVTERIRWDSVYMTHGFGHSNNKLTRAFGRGISDTELITNVKIDPETGSTGMRENFVTFLTEKPEDKEVVS